MKLDLKIFKWINLSSRQIELLINSLLYKIYRIFYKTHEIINNRNFILITAFYFNKKKKIS